MPTQKIFHAVAGSERSSLPEAVVVGEVDPKERMTITVKVRERPTGKDIRSHARDIGATPIRERRYLTHEEFATQHGANPDDLAKVAAFAHNHGLTIVESSIPQRSVKLSGTVEAFGIAFGVKLARYEAKKVRYRGRTGSIYVPSELAEIVESVMGFDNRPVAKPHYRRRQAVVGAKQAIGARNASDGSLSALDVAKLYNFPKNLDGTGQCIALIELNDIDTNTNAVTGTGFAATDLQTYFTNLNIPVPQVVALSVDGGANTPGADADSDGEATLDIEVAGAVAPGAKIAVYFSPNTDQGFSDAVAQAIHDSANSPSVISISWGGSEDLATQQYLDVMDKTIASAALLGITVCVATGDNGSADMVPQTCIQPNDPNPPTPWDGVPHADFPASSPHSLACGGTRLVGSGTTINSETVWNDGCRGGGGGGISNKFPRPDYQTGIKMPSSPTGFNGRGLPDVAGNADPATGYQIFLGGNNGVIGGTSAVAPLWAALIALINQGRVKAGGKTVGFLNPLIYNSSVASSRAFNDIVVGNNDLTGTLNGLYSAGLAWDACTGWGSPIGTQLFSALAGGSASAPVA